MTTLDNTLDAQIEAEARQKLAEALKVLAPQYNEVVKETGRERHYNFGQEFSDPDFLMGAATIYKLAGDGGDLPWPAMAWILQIMGGINPLYDEDHPEPPAKNQWREQWLILEVYHHGPGSSSIDIVASCNNEEEAYDLAGFLQTQRNTRGLTANSIHALRVPFPIYTNRDYQQTLDELRKKHWG